MSNDDIAQLVLQIIVIIGALNWLVTGLYRLSGRASLVPDLFYAIGLGGSTVQTLVYLLVGGSGIALAVLTGMELAE